MKKLKSYVQDNYFMPTIADPGETGENFGDRWDQEGWANFRNKMIYYSDKITEAYEEVDLDKSLEKWQFVFGDQFKKPNVSNQVQKELSDRSLITYDNTEQQLSNLGVSTILNPNYSVRINGRVTKKKGHREYDLKKNGNQVEKNRSISFSINRCSVPAPYKIYWKVLNRGEEAIKRNCIRGQIAEGNESRIEPTSFRGSHFVECYIVKDGVCVASDRQTVAII